MKTLDQCFAWYKDLYIDWMSAEHRARTEKTYSAMNDEEEALNKLVQLSDCLRFIYGHAFTEIEARWNQDSITEFYELLAAANKAGA